MHVDWCFFSLVLVLTGPDEMGSLPVWEQIVRKMMVDEDDINSDPSPLGNCI